MMAAVAGGGIAFIAHGGKRALRRGGNDVAGTGSPTSS
jgi:hypothetical protein